MKLATHNGVFQADDVFAAAVLLRIFPSAEIIRTRDEKELDKADIIFDVGGEFDPEVGLFDHHQRSGAGARPNGVLYSSAGLIWKHYGARMVESEIHKLVDQRLFQPIDAIDNGQSLHKGDAAFKGVPPHGLGISGVIAMMNPSWDEDGDFDKAFMKAVGVAQTILERAIAGARGTVLARELTMRALETREDVRLVVLNRFHPWQEVVVEDESALLVTFPSETGQWMVQCVPPALGSFEKRLPLPEEWAGLKGREFVEKTGLEGSIFCHSNRFIMGHETREGALELANRVLTSAVW